MNMIENFFACLVFKKLCVQLNGYHTPFWQTLITLKTQPSLMGYHKVYCLAVLLYNLTEPKAQ